MQVLPKGAANGSDDPAGVAANAIPPAQDLQSRKTMLNTKSTFSQQQISVGGRKVRAPGVHLSVS
jgi:hypothetical protein